MTNTKKVVFAKLFSKPANTKLSKTRKLKLSVVEDIQDAWSSFEEISSLASYYANERFDELLDEIYEFRSKLSEEVDNLAVNSSVSMLEEEGENLIQLLDKLETGAEDLGVDPSELLDEYVDIRERAEEAKYLYESFKDKYLEVVRDSGTLATFLSKHKAKLNKKK